MGNKELIEKFYRSFAAIDVEGMISCYHDDIEFHDPVFGLLKGNEAKKMWRMLVRPGIKITSHSVNADEESGNANWEAEYEFSPTRRRVINRITAQFKFKDGKIVKHTDHFDMWKWSRQALGLKGYLLGWSPLLKNKVRRYAQSQLKSYSH